MLIGPVLLMLSLAGCGGGQGVADASSAGSAVTVSAQQTVSTTTSDATSTPASPSQTATAASPSAPTTTTTTTTAPSSNTSPSTTASKHVVAFYGDSTMRGAETFNPSALAPVTAVQEMIADLPAGRFTGLNEGVNSSHTDQLLAGTDGVHPPWPQEVAGSKADIIVISHGSQFQPGLSTYRSNLHDLVTEARAAGKFVIFQTPNPTQNGREGMDPVVTAMKEQAVADNVPVIDVYEYLYSYITSAGKTVSDIIPDGYHPSDSTYVLIGKYVASEFSRIVP